MVTSDGALEALDTRASPGKGAPSLCPPHHQRRFVFISSQLLLDHTARPEVDLINGLRETDVVQQVEGSCEPPLVRVAALPPQGLLQTCYK